MEKEERKEPKLFIVLRVIACFALAIGITLIVLGIVFSAFVLIIPGAFVTFLSFPLFFISFLPKIHKVGVRTVKYLQENAKDDLTDISNTGAEIIEESVTKVARAAKTGWEGTTDSTAKDTSEDTLYCRYCGEKIPADSKFCKYCGKEQK